MAHNWTGHKIALCNCGCLKKAHFTIGKQRGGKAGRCSNCDCKKFKERAKFDSSSSRAGTNDFVLQFGGKTKT